MPAKQITLQLNKRKAEYLKNSDSHNTSLPTLDGNTLVSLTQVLLGLLEPVPEPAKDHLALNNGLLHDDARWLVLLEIVMYPVVKLVIVWVEVQAQGLHKHV